jgi:hypothetical protein
LAEISAFNDGTVDIRMRGPFKLLIRGQSKQNLDWPYFISERRVGALYVKAIFRAGHVGAGRCYEMTRYLVVRDLLEALLIAIIEGCPG